MDAATMAGLIVTNLKLLNGDIDAAQEALLLTNWEAICQGIIDNIVSGAVTSTTIPGGSSAGTYTGDITS